MIYQVYLNLCELIHYLMGWLGWRCSVLFGKLIDAFLGFQKKRINVIGMS